MERTLYRPIHRFQNGEWIEKEDTIVYEKALTIVINDKEIATVVCSPSDLDSMVAGFLLSEGMISGQLTPDQLTLDEEKGFAYLRIPGYENNLKSKGFMKRYVNSCCGRGRASFYYSNDAMMCQTSDSTLTISPEKVLQLAEKLESQAALFKQTGGVHCAALADLDDLWIFMEDVGRHNTLDKLLGYSSLHDISLEDKIIVFSGRISSEIVLKTSKMGCPILISRSAPTNLSLDLAEDLGLTVIGFTRNGCFNVYTGEQRVTSSQN